MPLRSPLNMWAFQLGAVRLSERLKPLWALFSRHGGSLRVVASAAEILGLTEHLSLPLPLKALDGADRQQLSALLDELEMA